MKVFIEDGDWETINMFTARKYEVVTDVADAEIVVFTGGEDVCPLLYREPRHPRTQYNVPRDIKCVDLFYDADSKIKVGICRGAQFLNVMCGGSMYQHVDNHNRPHKMYEIDTGDEFTTTSVHHQMMIPTNDADILLIADECENREVTVDLDNSLFQDNYEVECCWYEEHKCFCFQGHPEYMGTKTDTEEVFFRLLEKYIEKEEG